MASQSEIKTAQERFIDIITKRPSEAQVTKSVVAEVTDGLQCTVRDGKFTIIADASNALGGGNTASTAGTIARAGLAACLASGYVMIFARRGIPYDTLSVEVLADMDYRSLFAIEGTIPGYHNMRYLIHLESSADREVIMAAIEEADAASPVLHVFTDPVSVDREVLLNQKQDAAE